MIDKRIFEKKERKITIYNHYLDKGEEIKKGSGISFQDFLRIF